jgi:NHS family xanthosine MFS transporter
MRVGRKIGIDAFKLSGTKMALFFIFSMFLVVLQLTNMYGDTFISEFAKIQEYATLIKQYETVFSAKI